MTLVLPLTLLLTALQAAAATAVPGPSEIPPPEASPDAVAAAHLPVEELRLDNGMRFLLVDRPQADSVAAGWVARVGSALEDAERTGWSHFLEHLLFKGSRTVGARDPERELEILDRLDRTAAELRELEGREQRSDRGERRLETLRREFSTLQQEARSAAFLGELSLFYSRAGATGLNANTLEDLTMFYVTVPAEKLELWFWLESDRLLDPVFREFHKEKRVIREERRLRIESTPTGPLDERLRRLFWNGLPYGWRPMGGADHLAAASRAEIREYYGRHFTAPNLTAVLVGRLDRERVAELARRYFGRLGGAAPPAPDEPLPPREPAVAEWIAECDCPPQAQVLYRTVPFRHPDSYRLQVLAGLMNGRTGRLYRSLVLERRIAYSAGVLQHPLRRAGYFTFSGEAGGDADPRLVAAGWREEVERLIAEPVPADELRKVRNQITADAYRRLREPEALLRQLLIYDGLGEWRHINDWPERILRVTGEEVRDVARRYLAAEGLTALYYRRGTAPAAGASPE